MPKHLHKASKLFSTLELKRRIETEYQINSATEFLMKKVAKLEEQLEKAEQENSSLKTELAKYGKKEKSTRK